MATACLIKTIINGSIYRLNYRTVGTRFGLCSIFNSETESNKYHKEASLSTIAKMAITHDFVRNWVRKEEMRLLLGRNFLKARQFRFWSLIRVWLFAKLSKSKIHRLSNDSENLISSVWNTLLKTAPMPLMRINYYICRRMKKLVQELEGLLWERGWSMYLIRR